MADQQYCLRWNNHQPTLAGCFDRMLKDDQFTDCTLSAEGVNVVAHRMLLSACSPYFNELFKEYNKQQFPIVILRDVSVVELKALMDYMYRGEVNISQDQLADLLKVAEMLQIKGLYEAGFSESRASAPVQAAPRISTAAVSRPQPLDLPPDITSDGAASPAPRRRKRVRRRSSSDDFPTTIDVAAEPIGQAVAPATAQTEPVNNILSVSSLPVPPKLEEHQFDVVLPKEEYVDDQDSIENITLDDDDMDEMDQAGPSHGDGSSQGYPPSWHQSDRSTEDLFLSAQDSINNAGGAQRDSQALSTANEGTLQRPAEVYLKEEPFEIVNETSAAELRSTPLSRKVFDSIKPYQTRQEGRGLPKSVPMVRLESIDIPVRSSARIFARKSTPLPQATGQDKDKDSPKVRVPRLSLPALDVSEQSPSETGARNSLSLHETPSVSLPVSETRRYQLILPKPTSSGAAAERRRKAKELPKLRPKGSNQIAGNSAIQLLQPPTIIVPQTQAQSMIHPQPTTTTVMMSHFVNTAITPPVAPPKSVKWPLPPKFPASLASNINVLPDLPSLESIDGIEPSTPAGSKAKQLKKSSGHKVNTKFATSDGSTPIEVARSLISKVTRPVTNGYQCCFCSHLFQSMSELMTHLGTCSVLAAAKI